MERFEISRIPIRRHLKLMSMRIRVMNCLITVVFDACHFFRDLYTRYFAEIRLFIPFFMRS